MKEDDALSLPKGWEIKKIGELVEYDKNQKIHKDLPYIGLEHIESNSGRFIGSLEPEEVKSSTFYFNEDHVLYGRLRPYLNKVLLPNFEGHCSTEIFPIKVKKEISREFFFHWLLSESTVKKIDATWTGARMPRANMNQVLEFDFAFPPLPEQQRIVSILDEAFAAIAKAKANAEQNLKNAKELFESYLQGLFDKKVEGWETDKFVNLCNLITCGVAATPKYVDESVGVPFLSAQNVRDGEVVLDKFKHISKEFHKELTKKNKPKKGDILYSRVGAKYGEAGVVEHDFEFSVYVSVTLIKPKPEKLDNYFLKHLLNSPSIKEVARKTISSSGVPNLNVKDVREFLVSYPPITIQKQIVKEIETMRAETQKLEALNQKKIADLEELKKSILQKAFSGELTRREVGV